MDLLKTLSEKVAPGRAAVVTVDVQNDFCHAEGFLGKRGAPMHLIESMLPRLARFLDEARAQGVHGSGWFKSLRQEASAVAEPIGDRVTQGRTPR